MISLPPGTGGTTRAILFTVSIPAIGSWAFFEGFLDAAVSEGAGCVALATDLVAPFFAPGFFPFAAENAAFFRAGFTAFTALREAADFLEAVFFVAGFLFAAFLVAILTSSKIQGMFENKNSFIRSGTKELPPRYHPDYVQFANVAQVL
jgi:hypothetical protein